jgi:hypothetical protein
MKYLKIFEGFDKDKFYQEISYNDYMSLLGHEVIGDPRVYYGPSRIQMDWGLYRKCLSLFDSSRWSERGPYYLNKEDKEKQLEPYSLIVRNNINSIDIVISVLDDEWFLVNVVDYGRGSMSSGPKESYWKCDQWDGLVKLLVDKGFIK